MDVLLINGSPKGHRSNTYRLSSAFVEGLKQSAEVTVEEVTVSTLDIHPCLGCFACWNKTPGVCCIRDDMAVVLESILRADVIIWSFPLYYFSVPGPLKNLMDRQLPLSLPFMSSEAKSGGHPSRYDMSGKRHVVISTCGFYTPDGNYEGVNAIFDHLCGVNNYTAIYCGQGELFRVKELSQRTDEYLSHVRKAGQEFDCGGISAETRGKLNQLLYPRQVFEAMADASWGIENSGTPADDTLTFTRQMAALYNKQAYPGKDLVLEMYYTDVDKRYQIILGAEGSTVLTDDFRTATTVIETPYSLWKAIAAGEESGEGALMQQKYRVKGDFNLMIHWDKFFGSQTAQVLTVPAPKPTNMALLLIPWIAFWIGTASFEALSAGMISIAVSVLAPLVFRKNRMILSDHISSAVVCCLSLLLILGGSLNHVLPLSYLCFGLLWTVGGLLNTPLTAFYSANDYGGDAMMANPLFIKTNRILTLCWGLLYLAMTAWSFLLLDKGQQWVVTINSILPGAMGIFTLWFQKWYPAHVARGGKSIRRKSN